MLVSLKEILEDQEILKSCVYGFQGESRAGVPVNDCVIGKYQANQISDSDYCIAEEDGVHRTAKLGLDGVCADQRTDMFQKDRHYQDPKKVYGKDKWWLLIC